MKSKKTFQRDSIFVFKKTNTARCGMLCCALMLCIVLTVFTEGNLADFFLNNPWRIAILGQEDSGQETFWCDRLHSRTDVCLMRGDVHVVTGNSSYVVLHSRSSQKGDYCSRVEVIQPYTRKWEKETMASVKPVELKCKSIDHNELLTYTPNSNNLDSSCDTKHPVPAVLFSSAGFTGNPYHDFQDVLIPLFIVSQHLKGEVVFVVSDIRDWWVYRWRTVLQQLSHYPIVDFKEPTGDHCFPEVLIGLYIHKEFSLKPSLMPNGETIEDFQRMLYTAFAASPLSSESELPGSFSSQPYSNTGKDSVQVSQKLQKTRCLPKLLIVARKNTRMLINKKQVVKLAEDLGYEVQLVTLSDKVDLQTIYRWFHDSDVVMGVHGAELAHIMFMRRKAVLVQIVPLGTDWPSNQYYGRPALGDLGLQYMEYKIKPEESSLSQKYGLWHPIVRNPARFVAKGWETQKQLYLFEQSVNLSLTRLRRALHTARSRALDAFPLA